MLREELEIISQAILNEVEAYEFYKMAANQVGTDSSKKAKEKTKIDQARKLYDLLIKWEGTHLEQFTNQYNIYKEDWWADQGYAPF